MTYIMGDCLLKLNFMQFVNQNMIMILVDIFVHDSHLYRSPLAGGFLGQNLPGWPPYSSTSSGQKKFLMIHTAFLGFCHWYELPQHVPF